MEQLGLAEVLTQEVNLISSAHNWRGGHRITGCGFPISDCFDRTFHDYCLGIRPTDLEDVFHAKYVSDFGKNGLYGWSLADFSLDSSLGDGHNVTAAVEHQGSGEKKTIRA